MSTYTPPTGPTRMWFLGHRATPGCEHVISLDFERALELLPMQDDSLEPEFERLAMPLPYSLPPAALLPAPPPPPPSPIAAPEASPQGPSILDMPTARRRHTFRSDAFIVTAANDTNCNWSEMSNKMGGDTTGWTPSVIRNRYFRLMNKFFDQDVTPRAQTPEAKIPQYAAWTHRDDEMLRVAIDAVGCGMIPWESIADKAFQGRRTAQALRNRSQRLGFLANRRVALAMHECGDDLEDLIEN